MTVDVPRMQNPQQTKYVPYRLLTILKKKKEKKSSAYITIRIELSVERSLNKKGRFLFWSVAYLIYVVHK